MAAAEPETRNGLPIIAFADLAGLEAWLEAQPAGHAGMWLKFAKAASGAVTISKSDAIDAGLSFGWIDGQLHPYDERYFLTRFTPRRPKSKWSQVNVQRVEALITAGRMRAGGLREVERAKADGRWDAAYPPASRMEVPDDLRAALAENSAAGAFFTTLGSANRYAILYRLHAVTDPARRAMAVANWVGKLARRETVYD